MSRVLRLLWQLLPLVIPTVCLATPCPERCHVIYEVDNQTFRDTYQNYSAVLVALPHNITLLSLPDRCKVVELYQNSLQKFTKLRTLQLRICDIAQDICDSVFNGLLNLQELTIDFIGVLILSLHVTVKPSAFKPIQQLKALRIFPHSPDDYSFLRAFDVVGILRQLQQLEHFTLSTYTHTKSIVIEGNFQLPAIRSLDFSFNDWRHMPCIPIFTNLRYLNLTGNHIQAISFTENCLKTKNVTINFSNNVVQKIEKEDFRWYNEVKTLSLDFSQTYLSHIEPIVFQHLEQRNTTIASLTLGRDASMPFERIFFRTLFISLNSIKIYRLSLFGKGIEFREQTHKDYYLPVSTSLTHFSLTNAKVKALYKYGFKGLPNLECLDLSYDNIFEIYDKSFSGLAKLKILKLTGNQNFQINGHAVLFNGLKNTQINTLLLNNMGKWFRDLYVSGLKHLKYLDLSDNEIKANVTIVLKAVKTVIANNVLCNGQDSARLILELNSQIETLEVRNCMTCVSAFKNQAVYSMLLTLDASQNKNISLDSPPLCNVHMPRLRSLRLSDNNIKQLSNTAFANVQNLQYLDLSFNKLKVISREVFLKLKFLRKLNLTNNLINTIDAGTFRQLLHLKTLSLRGNRFECNCYLRPLRNWLRTKGPAEQELDNCRYPVYLNTTPIDAFFLNWIDCDGHVYIVIAASVAGFALMVTVMLTLTYYRLDIKYWYFFKYKYKYVETAEDRMYDAMACYDVDDVVWVRDHLVPQLEQGDDHQFQLCVHHRDFEVGKWIKENIVDSMNRSQNIIFVMTRKFMNSEWGQFELEMALMRLPEVKCKFIVMVMLEKIPKKLLKAKLRWFTRHLTYIEWPLGDDVEQRERQHFWKKLKLTLLQNRQACAVDSSTLLLGVQ